MSFSNHVLKYLPGAYIPNCKVILALRCLVIRICCKEDWGVPYSRKLQVYVIHRVVYYNKSFSSIATHTGYGKSLTVLVISMVCRGISIITVPLITVGSDKVATTTHVDKNIEASHID